EVADANDSLLVPDLVVASAPPAAQSSIDLTASESDWAIFNPDDLAVRSLLQQIADLQHQQAELVVIAEAYRHLGNVYRDRIEQGDLSPQNLICAMRAYRQVLHSIDGTHPAWAEVLNDLGNLCWLLSRGAPSLEQGIPHLQQGIASYRMALSGITPQSHPDLYPMIQNNLGAAYGDLARYQAPVENLQHSIHAYQEALLYRSVERNPLRYGSTQNNLGTTYWNLAQHVEPLKNLQNAIASYSEALRMYRPDTDPINYAMVQNNLGTTYWNLSQHEQSGDWLRLAIMAYETALCYRTMEANPGAFAATQNNLGTAYWHLATYVEETPAPKLVSLEKAIGAYERAIASVGYLQQSRHPIPLNFDVLATHNNLGLVQYQIATEPELEPVQDAPHHNSEYLNAALDHHLFALQGWRDRPELRQTALGCVIQTLQALYNQNGLTAQNLALAKVPGYLLPEIMPKL
ncbi:MAG: tetratricopeptide repeat protein, partial [Leptolyngbyaceae bacterium]|nr:tetratricopeptide repeat protein [Leptolyngbyaceae bacterium]